MTLQSACKPMKLSNFLSQMITLQYRIWLEVRHKSSINFRADFAARLARIARLSQQRMASAGAASCLSEKRVHETCLYNSALPAAWFAPRNAQPRLLSALIGNPAARRVIVSG
jgi:hypothetical protein